MELTKLIKLFRKNVFDQQEPYFWSDDDILLFINEAQNMFYRKLGGKADIYQIKYKADQELITLDSKFLDIRKVTDFYNPKYTLSLLNIEDEIDLTRTGKPEALVIGTTLTEARLYPIPEEEGKLKIHVYRLPKYSIETTSDELELEEHHHYYLLHWMKYLAYIEHDSEVYNQQIAQVEKNTFERYCEESSKEWEQLRHKVRVVNYGGLPGNIFKRRDY